MDARYNSEELKGVGIKEFPSKGLYCPKCQTWIPQFKDLTEVTETRLKTLIREGKQIMAMKELQNEVGCNKYERQSEGVLHLKGGRRYKLE